MKTDLQEMGKVIAELKQTYVLGLRKWETILRLHVRPKPAKMSQARWRKMVATVLVQSEQHL